ncbi:MAG TPA: hypothetical protein VNJ70_18015 [Thermoanaerobaculia bacterium]|nr:hypothetical protein [Thermoanaerobaculia bacterium]
MAKPKPAPPVARGRHGGPIPAQLAGLIRGSADDATGLIQPNFLAAQDLLRGRIEDWRAYSYTYPGDSNRDLNTWAEIKVAFAGVDIPHRKSLAPVAPNFATTWADRTRHQGSNNIPLAQNSVRLHLAGLRGDRAAFRKLRAWWRAWAFFQETVYWGAHELLSREYGGVTVESVLSARAALLKYAELDDNGLAVQAAQELERWLNEWVAENVPCIVQVVKQGMRGDGARSDRTDLALSLATAGLRSASGYKLRNQTEPILAILLGGLIPWSKYPCADSVAIAAVAGYVAPPELVEAARLHLAWMATDGSTPSILAPGSPLRRFAGLVPGLPPPKATEYHRAYFRGAGGRLGCVSWLGQDTHRSTSPTLLYAVAGDGGITMVATEKPSGTKRHRNVPPSWTQYELSAAGELEVTVLQERPGGPLVYDAKRITNVVEIDGRRVAA